VELGESFEEFDLGRSDALPKAQRAVEMLAQPFCLWVGSPVYVNHMAPPVEHFLSSLPERTNAFAVPFITWGAVNSGVALYEMGERLVAGGFTILGAAKIVAVHSLLWRSDRPLGAGHPGAKDDAAMEELVQVVQKKILTAKIEALPLDNLNYQPVDIQQGARQKSIATTKQALPDLAAEADSCSQCGICAENCPAGAIRLDPYPQFGQECFLCLNCVRECPESAIPFDTSVMEQHIRNVAEAVKETPPTRIFF